MVLIKLSVKDRLMIPAILPQKGDLINQTLIKDITNKIQLTQNELTEGEFKSIEKDGRITWNPFKVKDIEVEFTDAELTMLKEAVKTLDNEKGITQENIDLCIKITKS